MGLRVWGLGFKVQGLGLGFKPQGLGLCFFFFLRAFSPNMERFFRPGGFRVWGFGFGFWGLGFGVWGFGFGG